MVVALPAAAVQSLALPTSLHCGSVRHRVQRSASGIPGKTACLLLVGSAAGQRSLLRSRRRQRLARRAELKELPLPPGKPGNAFMDLLEYIKDPDAYIAAEVEKHGPIFQTNYFGRKTVIVGGAEGVADFIKAEVNVTRSALPDTFSELHTKYGSMNMAGEEHKSARTGVIAGAMCKDAIEAFLPIVERHAVEFVDSVEARGRLQLAKEMKDWCARLFTELFVGLPLDKEKQQWLYEYNEGLYGLLPWKLPFTAFGRGCTAKDKLVAFLKNHLEELIASGKLEEPKYAVQRRLLKNKDEFGQPWTTERVATGSMILIWGAYVELASLLADAIYLMSSRPDVCEKAYAEISAAEAGDTQKSVYLQAVLDETLRCLPPTGGGFRMAEEDIVIAGYRVPKGCIVSADPRVSNRDPSLHAEPKKFNPDRFAERPAQALPKNVWFPGGIGLHGCPGVPVAMAAAKVFLKVWLQRFQAWESAPGKAGEEKWITIPIRVLNDSYEMQVTKR